MYQFKTKVKNHIFMVQMVRLAVILSTILVLFSCKTEISPIKEFESADLMGVVYDGRARSIQDYIIVIDDSIQVSSDVNGRFTIPALKNGPHVLTGKLPGYETITLNFDFAHRTQFLYITSHALIDYLNDAELALAKKDYVQAQANIELAIKIDPSNTMCRYFQALILNNLNEHAKAYAVLNELLQENIREEAVYLLLLDIAKQVKDLRATIITDLQGQSNIMANPRLKSRIDKILAITQ